MEDPKHPGFLHNTHSFYHRSLNQMPWYKDLNLQQRGAHYLEPELNVCLLLRNGEALEWWTDFERTVDSFATFSRKDAGTIRRWRDEFVPLLDDIVTPESQSPPIPAEQRTRLLERTSAGRRLLEVSKLSPLEFGTSSNILSSRPASCSSMDSARWIFVRLALDTTFRHYSRTRRRCVLADPLA